MPYQSDWVDPATAVEHSGKKVYHVYRNDDVDQGQQTYWFTTDPMRGEDGDPPYVFDIREVFPELNPFPVDDDAIRGLLREAIDAGRLTFPDADDEDEATN